MLTADGKANACPRACQSRPTNASNYSCWTPHPPTLTTTPVRTETHTFRTSCSRRAIHGPANVFAARTHQYTFIAVTAVRRRRRRSHANARRHALYCCVRAGDTRKVANRIRRTDGRTDSSVSLALQKVGIPSLSKQKTEAATA